MKTLYSVVITVLVLLSNVFAIEDINTPVDIQFNITEAVKNKQLAVPCRIHLTDEKSQPQKAENGIFYRDHFVCDGQSHLKLPKGTYSYQIERGHEYKRLTGSFNIDINSPNKINLQIERLCNLANEGWYSGELHVHRPIEEIESLMKAEDLYVVPIITWWNGIDPWSGKPIPDKLTTQFDKNRFYNIMGGEDEHGGGAFLYFNVQHPVGISWAEHEYPGPMYFIEQSPWQKGCWIDIEKPFWLDVPIVLAHGYGDSIGIANNHMWRNGVLDDDVWGKKRDMKQFPPPFGNSLWSQFIYYQILNCGFRIPASAGSASGVMPNSIGYNRMYVYTGKKFTYENWWKAFKEGKTFVTNGPLLRVSANGQLPGFVFKADEGKQICLNIDINLDSNDEVLFIEIIKNGIVERSIPCSQTHLRDTIKNITFDKSGWFIIRAITNNKETFRFASTSPYYVEIGKNTKHISRQSVQFFIDWVNDRAGHIRLDKDEKEKFVLRYHNKAKEFWQNLLQSANAD